MFCGRDLFDFTFPPSLRVVSQLYWVRLELVNLTVFWILLN